MSLKLAAFCFDPSILLARKYQAHTSYWINPFDRFHGLANRSHVMRAVNIPCHGTLAKSSPRRKRLVLFTNGNEHNLKRI